MKPFHVLDMFLTFWHFKLYALVWFVFIWLWSYMVMFIYGYVLIWFCFYMVMFLYGYVFIWLCSYMVMFLYGYVLIWLCSYIVMFLFCVAGHDRFVNFNVIISNGGGGQSLLKLIDEGARLLETSEYEGFERFMYGTCGTQLLQQG